MPKPKAQLDAEIAQKLAEFGKRAQVHWGERKVEIDDAAYRRRHGAAPRGRGVWIFSIGGKTYHPGAAHGTKGLPYAPLPGANFALGLPSPEATRRYLSVSHKMLGTSEKSIVTPVGFSRYS